MGTHTFLLRAGVHPGQCSSCARVGSERVERLTVGLGLGCTAVGVQFWCTAPFLPPQASSFHSSARLLPLRPSVNFSSFTLSMQETHWSFEPSCVASSVLPWKGYPFGLEGVTLPSSPLPSCGRCALPPLVSVWCAQNIRIGCSGTEATFRTCDWVFDLLSLVIYHFPQGSDMCHGFCDTRPMPLLSSSWEEVPHWSLEVVSSPVPLTSSEVLFPTTRGRLFLGCRSAHLWHFQLQQALNTCIGSSGARAVGCWNFIASLPWLDSFLLEIGRGLTILVHSALLALLLLLVALLFRPFGLPSSPLGLLCGAFVLGVQVRPLVSLSVASPDKTVLDWSPWRNRKGKVPLSGFIPGFWLRSLTWVLIWLSIPEPVAATRLPTPVWVLLPSAYAMTRQESPDHPPGLPYSQRRPHLIPPDELTTHVGVCDYPCMSELCEPVDEVEEAVVLVESNRLPPMTLENRDEGSEWLGVHLMTPHYKTVALAIRPSERTMRSALDMLVQRFPSPSATSPDRVFDTVVPAHPQRFKNFGTFLRFSSSIRAVGVGGQTAVIVDLSHVGGHYFSAILPREIAYQELLEYLVPLSSDDDTPLSLYIGYQVDPCSPGAVVHLYDGVVITALRNPVGPPLRYRAEDIFAVDNTWCHPRSMFRITYCEAICVLHQNRRYTLPHHHHYGRTRCRVRLHAVASRPALHGHVLIPTW